MVHAGEIVQENELRDGILENRILRLSGTPRVKVRPAGRRDLFDIPPSELLAVLRCRYTGEIRLDRDTEVLFRMILDHYGFSLTPSRRVYLRKVLGRAKRIAQVEG